MLALLNLLTVLTGDIDGTGDGDGISLITILIVLGIICAIIFIFTRLRR